MIENALPEIGVYLGTILVLNTIVAARIWIACCGPIDKRVCITPSL